MTFAKNLPIEHTPGFAAARNELRRESLSLLVAVALVVFFVALVRTLAWRGEPDIFFTWPVALCLAAGLGMVASVRRNSPRLARWLFIVTLIAANALELVHFPFSPALYFFPVIGVVAALLLSDRGAGLIALCLPIVVVVVARLATALSTGQTVEWQWQQVLWATVVTALTSFVAWLGTRQLYQVLQWEWHSTQRAMQTAQEAQRHRGELARLNKELNGAYTRIDRMNQMLILARREAEDATALKVQFANAVSHELRSPINIIVGFSDMMVNSPEVYGSQPWPPKLQNHIAEIYQSSQHLSQLIDDVLDMARIDAYRLPLLKERVTVSAVIAEAFEIVHSLYDARRLYLRVDLEDDLPSVMLDRTRIRQVLLNLLTNAVRFTMEGGVCIRASRQAGEIKVSVTDTGMGIKPEDLPKLFEVFCQLESAYRWSRGSGLGLAISRQLVELHGGRIWAESEPGKGTTFSFTLPLEAEVADLTPDARSSGRGEDRFWANLEQKARERRSLVVLTDEPQAQRLLAAPLASYDIIWLPQASGEADLRQAVADAHPCAVIQLSGACSGTASSAIASGSLPGMPFVSFTLPGLAKAAHRRCLSDYLVKPISRRKLADALGRVARAAQVAQDVQGGNDKRIQCVVIVEDEAPMREFLRLSVNAIVGQPANIVDVDCCSAAVDAIVAHKPDVVLLDLNLPDGDGLELAAELHRRFGDDLPLIAISARDPRSGECEAAPDVMTCTRMERFTQREIEGLLNSVLTSFSSGLALDSATSTLAPESHPAPG
jgi:signal transduction histidine kinase/CheY-like chemotaxis protein